jgi:hypothetical protein
MKKLIGLFVLFIHVARSFYCPGQFLYQPAGGRSAAMAHASVIVEDAWAAINNPAGLSGADGISAGLYCENRFMLKELALQSGFVCIPVKTGAFGLSLMRQGYSAFNEMKAGVSYGMRMGRIMSAGIRLDYVCVQSGLEYDKNVNLATFELGIVTRLNQDISMGIHIINPVSVTGGPLQLSVKNSLVKVAIGYSFSSKILMSVQAEKDLISGILFRAGAEYILIPGLCFRTGLSTEPFQLCFGFGYIKGRFAMDVSSTIHQHLGWYPQLSVHFSGKKKGQGS